MSSAWPQIDESMMALPASMSDNDLFGTDLFGDELYELYGSSEIPALSFPETDISDNTEKKIDTAAQFPQQAHLSPTSVAMTDDMNLHPTEMNEFLPPPSLSTPTNTSSSNVNISRFNNTCDAANANSKKRSIGSVYYDGATHQSTPSGESGANGDDSQRNTNKNIVLASPVLSSATPPQIAATKETQDGYSISSKSPITQKLMLKASSQRSTPNPLISALEKSKVVTPLSKPTAHIDHGKVPQMSYSSAVPVSHPPMNSFNTRCNNSPISEVNHPGAPAVRGVTPSTSSTATKSEAHFTAAAQAAVSSLMVTAGNDAAAQQSSTHDDSDGFDLDNTVPDTSTAHITALTSSNWIAAISTNTTPVCSGTANGADGEVGTPQPGSKRRRQNLTPEERAKQNRDRNREHARNTRLRKKAYVEELKKTLTELVSQRDAGELERKQKAQRKTEQREIRFRVMEELLRLRGTNESNVSRWVAILEDEFSLSLPMTSYRRMVNDTNASMSSGSISRQVSIESFDEKTSSCETETRQTETANEQILRGATQVMKDATELESFLEQTFGTDASRGKKLSLSFNCDRKRFFMDGSTAMIDWTATLIDSVTTDLTFKGNMTAEFNPASNKLISAQLMFDTGAIIARLERKFRNESFDCHQGKDMLLDSMSMPYLSGVVVSDTSSRSVTSSEKSECSFDEHEVDL